MESVIFYFLPRLILLLMVALVIGIVIQTVNEQKAMKMVMFLLAVQLFIFGFV